MIKLYYTDSQEWKNPVICLPFYILITNTYYQIFWDGEKQSHFDFISSKFNKRFQVIEDYEIIYRTRRPRYKYNEDRDHIKYILKNPNEAKLLNAEQYLTHHNPYIRKVIVDANIQD